MEYVILVNESDVPIGSMEKMEAHQQGALHRAFSVFVFNSKGQLLLQQRASTKYHSPLLWTNTCCSHPRPGEATEVAAQRRCEEEMGLKPTLHHAFSFLYKANLDHDMIEHELDHVYLAYSDALPSPNPAEVQAFRWINPEEVVQELKAHPEQYTVWFGICLERVLAYYKQHHAH